MRIEDIEIHVGKPDFDYEPVRRLEAKCEATTAFSPAPTIDEMNGRLRSMAAKLGANAIVDVTYQSGASMTSWKSMKGTGLAVRKVSNDVPCPICAETIKRAATRCRHCGAEVEPQVIPQRSDEAEVQSSTDRSHKLVDAEPLRETNNPQTWLIVSLIVSVLFVIIAMANASRF